MTANRGKGFEGFVSTAMNLVPDTFVMRIYDPQGGYAGVATICDFVVNHRGKMYLIECKSVPKNLLPIYSTDEKHHYGKVSDAQWEGMLEATRKTGGRVVAGVLCWWVDHDVTRFLPIEELETLRNAGAKSIRYDANVPNSLEIAGVKRKVYFNYDFTEFFQTY